MLFHQSLTRDTLESHPCEGHEGSDCHIVRHAGRGEANVTLGIPWLRELLMTAQPQTLNRCHAARRARGGKRDAGHPAELLMTAQTPTLKRCHAARRARGGET